MRCQRSISEAIYLKRNPHGDPFHFSATLERRFNFCSDLGSGFIGRRDEEKQGSVRLGNTDPQLVKRFVEFLKIFYEYPEGKFHLACNI